MLRKKQESMELYAIATFLDKEIDITSVKDFCMNGLQFEGNPYVKRVGVAVDVTMHTIQEAIKQECDMLIAHHALIWNPIETITGRMAEMVKTLAKHDLSIYIAHLPLDIHKKYSHGKQITYLLGMHGISDFGIKDNVSFGVSGYIRRKEPIKTFKEMVDKKLETNAVLHAFGDEEVSHIGVVSGTGGFSIHEAHEKKIDCLITGDIKYKDLIAAKDYGINVILAGHYETEKWGMIQLGQAVAKKFKIETCFVPS